jgi:hypothetical protein
MVYQERKEGWRMEDILQSFLSFSDAGSLRENAAHLGPGTSFLKPKSPLLLPVFCCLSADAISYFSCNLSLEMAKRNNRISVIDFGLERPTVRYLMGNLVDLQNDFPAKNVHHLDFEIENIKLYGFSKITLVSLAVSGEQIYSKQIINRIFADQNIEESDIILINVPNGPDDLPAQEPFIHFQKSLFLMDSRTHSLLKTYSWIKKFLPVCQRYLAGVVFCPEENAGPHPDEKVGLPQQNAAKLGKVISKYLSINPSINPGVNPGVNPGINPGVNPGVNPDIDSRVNPGINTGLNHGIDPVDLVTDIPMDQEAINSIKNRKPLALTGSFSVSSQAISHLCENLLSNE